MIAVPFVYFTLLTLFLYKRHKSLDIAAFICIMYAAAGLGAVSIESLGISPYPNYRVGIFPAFAYCFLLTICLFPFISYSNLRIKAIKPFKNEKLLKTVAWVAFFWFLFTAVMSWGQFYGVITGDLGALRQAIYAGTADAGFMVSLPGPIRFVLTIFNMAFGCGWILIFFAFFCLIIQRLPVKYFLLYIFASLSGPWTSILGVDRSGVAYYLLALISVVLFFWPFMKRTEKKGIVLALGIIVSSLVVYLTAMTLSRFGGVMGDDTDAAKESLIDYLGRCYIDYSYFFDNVNNPDKRLNLLFPFLSKFVFGEELIGGVMLNQAIEAKTGVFTGVFLTYIGQIQLTAGLAVSIIFCVLFFSFANRFLSPVNRGVVSPIVPFLYLMFAEVMILGQYSYYYQNPSRTFSVFCFILLINHLGHKDSYISQENIINQRKAINK